MNFFGQQETNNSGFAKIEDRFYTNRIGYSTDFVNALRTFLALPLPRNVTFFNAAKAKTQRFLRELQTLSTNSDEWLELVRTRGIGLGRELEMLFQAVNRRINRQYTAAQIKEMQESIALRYKHNTDQMTLIGTWELGNSLEDDRVITELNSVSAINLHFAGITQIRDRRGGYSGMTASYQNLAVFLMWATFQESERLYNLAKAAEIAAQQAEMQAEMMATRPMNRQELVIKQPAQVVVSQKGGVSGFYGSSNYGASNYLGSLGNVFDASNDDYGSADIDLVSKTDERLDDEPLFSSQVVKGGGYTNPYIKVGAGDTFESDVIRYPTDDLKNVDYAPKEPDVIPKELIDSVVVKPTEVIRKDDGSVVETKEVLVQDGLTLPNGGEVTPDVKLTVTQVVTEKGDSVSVVATTSGELPTKTVITEQGEKKYLVDSAGVPAAEVRTSGTTGQPIVATNPITGEKTVVVSAQVPKEVKTAATQQIVEAPKSAATTTPAAAGNLKTTADTESYKGLMAMAFCAAAAVGITYVMK